MSTLAAQTSKRLREALDDDLNTAQAQAAIFDMIRAANAAIDSSELKQDDVPLLHAAIDQFDAIFSVLQDDDAENMKKILDWAEAEGRGKEISPELREIVRSTALSDSAIESKIVAMSEARKARNFARSDAIRAELTAQGILIEQTKEGVRWRRK